MTDIYINLVPIKSGGGLQNSLNLLTGIHEIGGMDFTVIVSNQKLYEYCINYNFKVVKIGNGLLNRLKFETIFFRKIKNSIIFTLFGGKPLFSYKNFTISGNAYSNLFYPEIKFWDYLPLHKQIIKKAIDFYRLYNTKKSNIVIFETETLQSKAIKMNVCKKNTSYVVKMAVSKLVENSEFVNFKKKLNIDIDRNSILYLASSHPNKRQHLIIEIAKELIKKNKDFKFVLTLNNNKYANKVMKKVREYKLEKNVINIGLVEPELVGTLIHQAGFLINIAKLESFSNNFIESWTYKKNIFLTDADWSRNICKESAIYLTPENVIESSYIINRYLVNNADEKLKMINHYPHILEAYNNYYTKTLKYMEIIYKYVDYWKEEKN